MVKDDLEEMRCLINSYQFTDGYYEREIRYKMLIKTSLN